MGRERAVLVSWLEGVFAPSVQLWLWHWKGESRSIIAFCSECSYVVSAMLPPILRSSINKSRHGSPPTESPTRS